MINRKYTLKCYICFIWLDYRLSYLLYNIVEKPLHRQVHAGIGIQIESAGPGLGVLHIRGVSTIYLCVQHNTV